MFAKPQDLRDNKCKKLKKYNYAKVEGSREKLENIEYKMD